MEQNASDGKENPHWITGFRNIFLTGLVSLIPVFLTVWIISILFRLLNGLIPIRFNIPGMGFVVTILFVLFWGLLVRNFFGKRILDNLELLILKIPLVNNIYVSSKQMVDAITQSAAAPASFKRVVLVEYPRKGMYTLAFVTREKSPWLTMNGKKHENMISVFLPTTPNPATGYFALIPKEDIITVNISVEEGLKLIISGGIIAPEERIRE